MANVHDVAKRLDATKAVASVHKASTGGHGPVPDLLITSHGEIPSSHGRSLDEIRRTFETDAKQIESALWEALPGGTFDALVGLMLHRKASQFVVSHAR